MEDDTVAGKTGKSCLVTLTDRYYRFLKIQKVAVKKSKLVIEAMVKMLEPLTKHTVTPDRGKESIFLIPMLHGNEGLMRIRMDY